MSSCRHPGWLRLLRNNDNVIVEHSDRPERILTEISSTELSIIATFGGQGKARALADLGIKQQYQPARGHGEVNLLASSLHDSHGRSIVIADVGRPMHNRLPTMRRRQQCHVNSWIENRRVLKQYRAADLAQDLYHESVFPHVDAICLFVADLGGPLATIRIVTSWLDKGRPSTSPIRPCLLLVVSKAQKSMVQAAVLHIKRSSNFAQFFQKVQIVIDRSSRARRNRNASLLRREIIRASNCSYKDRSDLGYLFSGRHTIQFLSASIKATSALYSPFDFIKASRGWNSVDRDQPDHLTDFLTQFSTSESLNDALPLVASSFILDHYPPGMHRFHPRAVFQTLYRGSCHAIQQDAVGQSGQLQLPTGFLDILENHMAQLFERFEALGSSIALHREKLASLSDSADMRSLKKTCCYCIRRDYHRHLPCGHCICHTCIRIFYSKQKAEKNVYDVVSCLICGRSTDGLRIGIKPDTASVRVLSIDGGGSRARLPLEFLLRLQDCIGLPCPVQQHFDVAFGTSSGAMAVCALFFNGWPVEMCIRYLDVAARLSFQKPLALRLVSSLLSKRPLLSYAVQFLLTLWNNSKYSADKLEMIQKDIYGLNRSIVDSHIASKTGVLIGVTLTGTRDTKAYIATNYNSGGGADSRAGYTALKSERRISDIPLWEILRCCTAAPYYFTAHNIEGCGTFQDGGLTYNNPAPLALKEAEATFPTAGRPSIFASFGTGFVEEPCEQGEAGKSPMSSLPATKGWEEWYPVRCVRALLKLSDSKAAWDKFEHVRCDGFFRFDLGFDSKSPPLDDVIELEHLARLGKEAAEASLAVVELARRIRAELFIFELDDQQPPRFNNGSYDCVGNIHCRLKQDSPELRSFLAGLHQSSAFFLCQNEAVEHEFSEYTQDVVDFQKQIRFRVQSRQAHVEIALKENSQLPSYKISGSPFTLDWLLHQQGLEAWFGTSDHRKRQQEHAFEPPTKRLRGMP